MWMWMWKYIANPSEPHKKQHLQTITKIKRKKSTNQIDLLYYIRECRVKPAAMLKRDFSYSAFLLVSRTRYTRLVSLATEGKTRNSPKAGQHLQNLLSERLALGLNCSDFWLHSDVRPYISSQKTRYRYSCHLQNVNSARFIQIMKTEAWKIAQ